MKAANAIPEEKILDAAYALMMSIGMQRMTMAEVARRADASRATLYRRWGSVRDIIASLASREWTAVVSATDFPADNTPARGQLVDAVVRLVSQIRIHPLMRKIIELDPDFLLPYLLQRRGTNTNQQLSLLETGIRAGHADGSVYKAEVGLQAKTVLLTAWSFTLTGPVLVDDDSGCGAATQALDEQLRVLLDRYLTPRP